MAFFEGSYFSETLLQDVHFSCIRPFENRPREQEEKFLVLLHGLMDNCTAWFLKTDLYRLADAYGVTVFCPEGHRSYYCDMAYGGKYRQMVSREIPRVMQGILGCELNGENTVIAGNSAGGYGALKAVLNPESVYQKCMAFSPVTDWERGQSDIPESYRIPEEAGAILGSAKRLPPEEDLKGLANCLAPWKKKDLKLTITCGTEDFLIEQNRVFYRQLQEAGIPVCYREAEGEHGWDYWSWHLKELFEEFFS